LWRPGQAPHLVGTDLVADANQIIHGHRKAVAALLMTPAPFSSSVSKKYGLIRSAQFRFVGLTDQEVDAQIEADEAFLKACPRRKRGSCRDSG
jgi:hypothetical protein